jgi:hypothetical protein
VEDVPWVEPKPGAQHQSGGETEQEKPERKLGEAAG